MLMVTFKTKLIEQRLSANAGRPMCCGLESYGRVAVWLLIIRFSTAPLGMLVMPRHMKPCVFHIQIPATGLPIHSQSQWRSEFLVVATKNFLQIPLASCRSRLRHEYVYELNNVDGELFMIV